MSSEPLAEAKVNSDVDIGAHRGGAPTAAANGGAACGASFWESVATMLSIFVGGSSVMLPYAFRLSGWLFVPVLLAVGVLIGFTLWIMGFLLESVDRRAEEMGVPRSQRDWGLLGYMAFGTPGRLLFAGFMLFDLVGGALVFMSIIIEQLTFLLPIRHVVTASLSCILAILLCLLPKKAFSRMAVAGMVSQAFLVLGLVVTGLQLHCSHEIATDQTALDLSGLPQGFGIALMCFLGHSKAPLIYQMMEDRKQWTKVVVYSMTFTETFLLSFGILGYGFFGSSVKQSIADNIGRDLALQPLPDAWNVLLGAATILGLSSKQLVTLPLILDATTDLFGESLAKGGQLTVKAMILILSTILCLVLKHAVDLIASLVGIMLANCVCVIFPCMALLKLHHMHRWKCGAVLLVVILFGLYSIYATCETIQHAVL